MKKRLCLFMMLLLLFMSVGCSQTTPPIPEPPVTETSKTDADSTTAVDPNEGESLNADIDIAGSGIAEDGSLPNDPDASFDDSKTDNAEYDGSTDADINEDDVNVDDVNAGASDSSALPEDGSYTSKEDVALYIYLYGHLPPNFITKKEAEKLGWNGGSLEPIAPGMCIGGSPFGNYEGILPQEEGRSYTECDIDTLGADKRGAKRIVFSNDGLIYYTEDHYKSFELLYGETDP